MPTMERFTRVHPAKKGIARRLRREMTDAESRLWRYLRREQISGFKFRRQHPYGRYVLDFVCLEAKLVVEIDGGQHSMQTESDQLRTNWLARRGFRVLRFWNHEVLLRTEDVTTAIWRALHTSVPPPSRPSPFQGEGV